MTAIAPAEVELVDSILDVPPDAWNGLAGADDLYQSHEWLAMVERDSTARSYYLLAWREGRLAGAMPVYAVHHEASPAYQPDRIRQLLALDGDFLVAGARRCYRSDIMVAADLRPAARLEVTAALVRRALRLAEQLGRSGVAFCYLADEGLGRLAAVAPVRAAFDGGENLLEGVGDGMAGYLDRCTSKLRAKIRRERRGFAETGWSTGVESLADCLADVARLLSQVEQRHGNELPEALLRRLLRRQVAAISDREVLLTCRDQRGDLLACGVNYRWHQSLYSRAVGLDYDRLAGSFGYFNVLIYQAIDYAAEHGLDRLHLGLASCAKTERGAVVRRLWTAFVQVEPQPDGCGPGVRLVDPAAAQRWSEPYRRYSDALCPPGWRRPPAPSR
ncbi:MAG: GNAT family N-acetyltransferase [Jatrophihabitans sp.]